MSDTLTKNPLIADNYFNEHPEKVLGEIIHTTDRFGKPAIKIKGNLDDLNKIDIPSDITIKKYFELLDNYDYSHTPQDEILKKVLDNEKKRTLEVAIRRRSGVAENNDVNYDVSYDSEFWHTYNSQISRDELEAFLYSQSLDNKKFIDKFENTKDQLVEKGLLFYDDGNFIYKWIYAIGDIYKKRQQLVSDKETIIQLYSENVFNTQLDFIDNLIPDTKKLPTKKDEKNAIYLNMNSKDSKLFILKYGENKGDSIHKSYLKYINNNVPDNEFQSLTKTEYTDYIKGENLIPSKAETLSDAEHKSIVRAAFRKIEVAKNLTNRFVPQFILDKIDIQDKTDFEKYWNKQYNKNNLPQTKYDGTNELITKVP